MAQNVYLRLRLDGEDIAGDSTTSSFDRADDIECSMFHFGALVPEDVSSGRLTGRMQYEPIVIRKRVDRSSPRLMQGLAEHAPVEAVFRFFRPDVSGSGQEEHFYTIRIEDAHISHVEIDSEALEQAYINWPAVEKVYFGFRRITFIYEPDGIEFMHEFRGDETISRRTSGTTTSVAEGDTRYSLAGLDRSMLQLVELLHRQQRESDHLKEALLDQSIEDANDSLEDAKEEFKKALEMVEKAMRAKAKATQKITNP